MNYLADISDTDTAADARYMISIVIPVYNAQDYIDLTLNSILDQDFDDYEILLVDDCKWAGSGYGGSSDDPNMVDMKFAYLRTGNDPADSFYFSGVVGNGGTFRLSANNSAWMTETKNSLWGTYTLYFRPPNPVGSDGKWHKYAMHINYSSSNPVMRLYVDDQVLVRTDNGQSDIPMPADYRLETFQIPYTGNAQVNQSSDRTGICNGWQIDDIQVWNGMPFADKADESPPRQPDGLSITVSNQQPLQGSR